MFTAEQLEQVVIPALHAQTNAVDSALSQHRSFSRRDTAGVCFQCPFSQIAQIEDVSKAPKQRLKGGAAQDRWCSTAKKNRLESKRNFSADMVGFEDESAAELRHISGIAAGLVESAI